MNEVITNRGHFATLTSLLFSLRDSVTSPKSVNLRKMSLCQNSFTLQKRSLRQRVTWRSVNSLMHHFVKKRQLAKTASFLQKSVISPKRVVYEKHTMNSINEIIGGPECQESDDKFQNKILEH